MACHALVAAHQAVPPIAPQRQSLVLAGDSDEDQGVRDTMPVAQLPRGAWHGLQAAGDSGEDAPDQTMGRASARLPARNRPRTGSPGRKRIRHSRAPRAAADRDGRVPRADVGTRAPRDTSVGPAVCHGLGPQIAIGGLGITASEDTATDSDSACPLGPARHDLVPPLAPWPRAAPRAKAPCRPARHGLAPPRTPAKGAAGEEFCFRWAHRLWAAVVGVVGLGEVMARFFSPTPIQVSSHFSGIGTVEAAMAMLAAAAKATFSSPLRFRSAFAVDASAACRKALVTRGACGCVFRDILDRLGPQARAAAAGDAGRLDYQAARRAIAQAPAEQAALCTAHGGQCVIPAVDVDISGSPCVPWSRMSGKRRLGRAHPLVGLLLAWCRILRLRPVTLAIHENVVGFDESVLHEELGEMYTITRLDVVPADAGFGFMRRPRRYHILVLRSRARLARDIRSLYAAVSAAMQSAPLGGSGDWAWRAERAELLAAENAARSRLRLPPRLDADGPSVDWAYLLSPQKQQFLAKYRMDALAAGVPGEACIFDLSQNPGRGRPQSGIPPFRRSGGRYWSDARGRWLLPRERMAAMGYAVYPDLASIAAVPLDSAAAQAPAFTVGNAMHVANVGCVIVCALLAVVPIEP